MKTAVQLVASSVIGLGVLALVLFLPAGTVNYWQAWVFIAAFTVATIVPSLYLARPTRRLCSGACMVGPLAESQTGSKIDHHRRVSGPLRDDGVERVDHRMGWSSVPAWVCVLGDVLVVFGLDVSPCW